MTTTLRPTEPLQRAADGGLSRRYHVCVNSRPVGAVHLATHAEFGHSVAMVRDLHIDQPDRGRGRGTVAMLAAEEVARGWACARIETSVPADADRALAFVAALGYTERSRRMAKPLDAERFPLPQGSRDRPMTAAEYPEWATRQMDVYARSWQARGVPQDQARAKAERDQARALPAGLDTEGTQLTVLEHEGTAVGTLWLTVHGAEAFVLSVDVEEEYRGRGHGRTLMRLAETAAAAAGRERIGLHVFTDNTPAVRLYGSLGYRPVSYYLYKSLL